MGDPDKLKEMCETAIKDPEQSTLDWGIVGSYFLVNEQYDKAVKANNYYLKKNMDSPIHWVNLGIALLKKGEHESSISACKKALTIDPSFKFAWGHLAGTYSDMGKTKEALDACEKALEIDPLYNDALELFKELKAKLGENILKDDNGSLQWAGGEKKPKRSAFRNREIVWETSTPYSSDQIERL